MDSEVHSADVHAAIATRLDRTETAVRVEHVVAAAPVPVVDHESDEAEPPLDEIEAGVAAIWQRVLKREKVGRDADFFDLGGDSMTGVVVIGLLNTSFGSDLEVLDLYNLITLAEVAQALRDSSERRSALE